MIRFLGWCCRVSWWVVFWPIGLLLSCRRGTRRRHAQTIAALHQHRPAR